MWCVHFVPPPRGASYRKPQEHVLQTGSARLYTAYHLDRLPGDRVLSLCRTGCGHPPHIDGQGARSVAAGWVHDSSSIMACGIGRPRPSRGTDAGISPHRLHSHERSPMQPGGRGMGLPGGGGTRTMHWIGRCATSTEPHIPLKQIMAHNATHFYCKKNVRRGVAIKKKPAFRYSHERQVAWFRHCAGKGCLLKGTGPVPRIIGMGPLFSVQEFLLGRVSCPLPVEKLSVREAGLFYVREAAKSGRLLQVCSWRIIL